MDKKKLIIFDFDGVLFNSLKNMEIAWENVNLKFGLKIEFQEYKKNIGFPFQEILKNLGIHSNRTQIQKYYNLISSYNIDKIQPYKNTLKTINKLKLKNIKIAICTSKDKIRTRSVIKKYNLEFDAIETISTNIKGKPNPDQILRIIKNLKELKKNSVYIGDMYVDYLTAKNAKIDYIHAQWGFSHAKSYMLSINSIDKIFRYLV